MAAGDFTASAFPNMLVAMDDIMTGETPIGAETNHPVNTATALLENQSVDTRELVTDGRCIGVDAWFLEVGSHLLIYSGTVADDEQGCDLETGVQLQSRKLEFRNNYHIKSGFQVNARKCGNASDWASEMAKGLARAMSENRKAFNNLHAIPLLASSSQANQYAEIDPMFTDYGSGNRLKVDASKMEYEIVPELSLIAENNLMPNYLMLSGRNLYMDKVLAEYRRENDNQRDQLAIFDDVKMYWDTRNMDTVLGRRSTFLVNPASFLFWNTAWWSETPVQVDASTNTWHYKVMDPVLKYNDNGTMKPVWHHVEQSYTCASRDELGEPVYAYTVNVTMIGGFYKAPDGFNRPISTATAPTTAITGVMEIVATPAGV